MIGLLYEHEDLYKIGSKDVDFMYTPSLFILHLKPLTIKPTASVLLPANPTATGTEAQGTPEKLGMIKKKQRLFMLSQMKGE